AFGSVTHAFNTEPAFETSVMSTFVGSKRTIASTAFTSFPSVLTVTATTIGAFGRIDAEPGLNESTAACTVLNPKNQMPSAMEKPRTNRLELPWNLMLGAWIFITGGADRSSSRGG